MSNLLEKASILTTPTAYNDGKILSVKPNTSVGDFDFTRGSSATRVNELGFIEEVGNNLPRINYTDGVGSWLFEPQRTNNLNYSEQFDNAYWINNGVTINSNQIISPDGNLNADLLTGVSGGLGVVVFSKWSSTNNVASCFAKKGSTSLFKIANVSSGNRYVIFNLENGTVSEQSTGWTGSIEDYGNGWYRCTAISNNETGTFSLGVTSATESVYLWGAQLEEDYPTSYIKTTSAAVTRLQDAAFGAGSSDLINSTEGVLYAEISALADDLTFRLISLSDGTTSNRLSLGYRTTSNAIYCEIRNANVTQAFLITTINDIKTKSKVAVKYKENDFAMWVNGVEVSTDTSGITPINLSKINFDSGQQTGGYFYGNVKCVAVFKEALTDEELICLTQV